MTAALLKDVCSCPFQVDILVVVLHIVFVPQNTCTVNVDHVPPSSYRFETKPKPIAKDFTELLVIQTADPFQEYIGLSSSTCEQPAATTVHLAQEKYYAVCCHRLVRGESSGVSVIHSASLPIYFKSCEFHRVYMYISTV